MIKTTNPILKGDFPDLSIIRVNNAFYMVSTTMYFCPVAPIMKSNDLVNWQIISYCADIIEDTPEFRLETEDEERIGDYGRGQWASSIRFMQNKFWVMFTNNTTEKTYVFFTENPEIGLWERIEYNRRFHDPSMFYDESSGKMFVLHGFDDIFLTELETDLTNIKKDGTDKQILWEAGEGSHIYKLHGYYYIFTIVWIDNIRTVNCYRSKNINGSYEKKQVLRKGLGTISGGVAQGGIVDTPSGKWYGFFFQDRDAVGRVPVLVPMTWTEDHWPLFGNENGDIPIELDVEQSKNHNQNYYFNDEFDNDKLQLAWQWNHNPDNNNWSLAERKGFLRIKKGRTSRTIYHARNTLTQRTFEPECEAIIAMEPGCMKDGDIAGLVVLQGTSGFIGIEQNGNQKYIVMYTASNDDEHKGKNAIETLIAKESFNNDRIYFKAKCIFKGNDEQKNETASFYYSTDLENWKKLGIDVNLKWTMSHFTGARFGLFYYSKREPGGYVDFDFYHVKH